MIDFSSGYTYSDILSGMLAEVDDSLDKREGSLIQTALAPVAWYLEGLALALSQIQGGASVLTAQGSDLDYLVANRGLTRTAATYAVRRGAFNVQIPAGSEFKTVNGADSVVFSSGDFIEESGGLYVYALTCETAGEIGNSYTGTILPVTAIAGLQTATIGAIITVGADAETDASLRARYIETFTAAPYGGNITEYRQAILAIPGVGGVQVYPAESYNGGGTVLCSICSDEFTAVDSSLVTAVQNAICPPGDGSDDPSPDGYGIAPVGAAVDIVSATNKTINIEFTATFAASVSNGNVVYADEIRDAISAYIASVAESWGNALRSRAIAYNVTIYAARIIAAVLTVPEVINVSNLTINGASGDLQMTETSALQEIPVLGEVIIHV